MILNYKDVHLCLCYITKQDWFTFRKTAQSPSNEPMAVICYFYAVLWPKAILNYLHWNSFLECVCCHSTQDCIHWLTLPLLLIAAWRMCWETDNRHTFSLSAFFFFASCLGGVKKRSHGRRLLDHQRGEVRGHWLFRPLYWDRHQRHGLSQQWHRFALGFLRWGRRAVKGWGRAAEMDQGKRPKAVFWPVWALIQERPVKLVGMSSFVQFIEKN